MGPLSGFDGEIPLPELHSAELDEDPADTSEDVSKGVDPNPTPLSITLPESDEASRLHESNGAWKRSQQVARYLRKEAGDYRHLGKNTIAGILEDCAVEIARNGVLP